MKQQTLSGFERFGKMTRRAQFLSDTDRTIPWTELAGAVEKVYPKGSDARRRPGTPVQRVGTSSEGSRDGR
jgi:hypothetical protein